MSNWIILLLWGSLLSEHIEHHERLGTVISAVGFGAGAFVCLLGLIEGHLDRQLAKRRRP